MCRSSFQLEAAAKQPAETPGGHHSQPRNSLACLKLKSENYHFYSSILVRNVMCYLIRIRGLYVFMLK